MPLTDIAAVTVDASWSTNPDDVPAWENIPPVERVTLGQTGRNYEYDAVNPTRGTIAVDNTDGAYSAGRPANPMSWGGTSTWGTPTSWGRGAGIITTDKRIRVQAALVGGSTYTLADHVIEACPTTMDSGGFDYASSSFRTIDMLDAMGCRTLRSPIVEETIHGGATAYFTLGDDVTSSGAGDMVSSTIAPLLSANTAGYGGAGHSTGVGQFGGSPFWPMTDPTTNLAFTAGIEAGNVTGGHYVALSGPTGGPSLSPNGDILRLTFVVPAGSGGQLFYQQNPDPSTGVFAPFSVSVSTSGAISVAAPGMATLTTSAIFGDGAAHTVHVAYTAAGALTLNVDDLSSHTATGTGMTASAMNPSGWTVLGAVLAPDGTISNPLTGQLGHVVFADPLASPAADWVNAILGFAAEAASTRLTRILGWVGQTAAGVIGSANFSPMSAQNCSGKTVLQECLDVAAAVDGIFFADPTGIPVFRPRDFRYKIPSLVTFGTTALPVDTSALTFDYDRQHMVNDMFATRPNGPTIRVQDQASIAAHRTRNALGGSTVSFAVNSDDQLADAASWYLYLYSEPRLRIGSIRLRPYTTPALAVWACTLRPFDRITITNLPPNAPAATMEFLIESIGHPQIDNSEWICELALSPWLPVLTLDDANYGALDADVLSPAWLPVMVLDDATYGLLDTADLGY